jgi:hypothetical protein
MPNGYDVAMLQGMLLDQLAVDVGSVRAVEILKKGIVEDIDNKRMMATDSRVVDSNIIVRQAPDRITLFRHVVFRQSLIVQTKD